jgi:hypothetical protein
MRSSSSNSAIDSPDTVAGATQRVPTPVFSEVVSGLINRYAGGVTSIGALVFLHVVPGRLGKALVSANALDRIVVRSSTVLAGECLAGPYTGRMVRIDDGVLSQGPRGRRKPLIGVDFSKESVRE